MSITLNFRTDLVPSEEHFEQIRRIGDSFLSNLAPDDGVEENTKTFRVDSSNQKSKYYDRLGNFLLNMKRVLMIEDAQIRISKGNSNPDYARNNVTNFTQTNSRYISYFIRVMVDQGIMQVVEDFVKGKSYTTYTITEHGRNVMAPIKGVVADTSRPVTFKSALTDKGHVTYVEAIEDEDMSLLASVYADRWTIAGKPVDNTAPIRRVIGDDTDSLTSWVDMVDSRMVEDLQHNYNPTVALSTPYVMVSKLASQVGATPDFTMFGDAMSEAFYGEVILKVIRKEGDLRKAHKSFVKTCSGFQDRSYATFETMFNNFFKKNRWIADLYGADLKDLFCAGENLNIKLQVFLARNDVPALVKSHKGNVQFIIPEDKAMKFKGLVREFFESKVEEEVVETTNPVEDNIIDLKAIYSTAGKINEQPSYIPEEEGVAEDEEVEFEPADIGEAAELYNPDTNKAEFVKGSFDEFLSKPFAYKLAAE